MVRTAPVVLFSDSSLNYGTIDVGDSSAILPYTVFLSANSTMMTEAIHMSVSYKESTNAAEARMESWVYVSTPYRGLSRIGSYSTGPELPVNSISGEFYSAAMTTKVVVPATAATAGAVAFYLHHRYQYTGDDD